MHNSHQVSWATQNKTIWRLINSQCKDLNEKISIYWGLISDKTTISQFRKNVHELKDFVAYIAGDSKKKESIY